MFFNPFKTVQSSSNTIALTPRAKQIHLAIVLNIIEEGFGSFRIVDTVTPHLHAFVSTEEAKLEIGGQANIQVASLLAIFSSD